MPDSINQELLKRLKSPTEEVRVLVVAAGPVPRDEVYWASLKVDCALCGGPAHMDAKNLEAAKNMIKVCHICMIREGFMCDALSSGSSLVQGERLSLEDGIKATMEMTRPTPKEEAN